MNCDEDEDDEDGNDHDAEINKPLVWVCRSSELGRILDVGDLDHFVKLSRVPIEFRIIGIKPQIENSQFEVHTDGSRIGDDCGFSVCILKNEHPFKIFKFKLSKNNTVFQAELAAINFAVRWAQENGSKINIYTDSQSSIEALRSTRPRSAFVIEAKKNFYLAGNSVGLTWVKAHVGDPGAYRHSVLEQTATQTAKRDRKISKAGLPCSVNVLEQSTIVTLEGFDWTSESDVTLLHNASAVRHSYLVYSS
ncbi:hypothetical protein AVEN_237630-1 [Araneus ventricosus]|uniref:RNase H type-1 domain-containing protein n=1 Tax=Araneus ventricosus TaxID=182803 RepID=A0A4Y2W896_ARAVE|nr:hypothetical protein AVEN_237630-1 [Araneus ventricosus]